MADLVSGGKVGAFVMFVDEDGLHRAVRSQAMLALSDADGTGSDTILQLPGNRAVIVRRPMQEVPACQPACMVARCYAGGDLGQMNVHRLRVAPGQH